MYLRDALCNERHVWYNELCNALSVVVRSLSRKWCIVMTSDAENAFALEIVGTAEDETQRDNVSPMLTTVAEKPLDQHPAAVYLSKLRGDGRRTMRGALNTIAGLLGREPVRNDDGYDIRYLFVSWEHLRYQHTQAVLTALTQPIPQPIPAGEAEPLPPITLAPATVNKYRAALRGVLRECFRLGLMNGDDYQRAIAVESVRNERLPKGRQIDSGEIMALLRACANDPGPLGRRDQALIAVLTSSGLRRSEASALNVDDYNAKDSALRVRFGKGNKERLVYLTGGAIPALEAWIAVRDTAIGRAGKGPHPLFVSIRKGGHVTSNRLKPEGVRDMLAERVAQAATDPLAPHDFRRTFISNLLEEGEDLAVVQRLAGHANIATTASYDRRGEKAKRKAVSKLHVPTITPAESTQAPKAARQGKRGSLS